MAAKVSIDTSAPGAPVLPGKVYDWPFAVKNQGLTRADSVTFTAPLSGSLEFVSAQQNCSFKDSGAVCQLGSLKPGESKLGVLTAKVAEKTPGGQSIDGDALVRWRSRQKEGQATAAFPQVKVADTADVSVVKGGPAVIRPGQRLPYEVTVANNGPTAARHVMLTSTTVPILAQAASDCTIQNAQGNGHGAAQGNGQADGQGNGQADGQGNGKADGQGNGKADDQGNGPRRGHGDLGRPVNRPDQARSGGSVSGPDHGRSDGQSNGPDHGPDHGPDRGRFDGRSGGPVSGSDQARSGGPVSGDHGRSGGSVSGSDHGRSDGQSDGPGHGLGDAAPGADQGLVCDIGTLQPGEKRAIRINAQARTGLTPGTVIQAPSQVSTTTIDSNLANNHADTRTKVAASAEGHAAPRGTSGTSKAAPGAASGAAPGAASGAASGAAPGAATGLPNTGAPISELLHLVVVLVGMGLICYRLGRVRNVWR